MESSSSNILDQRITLQDAADNNLFFNSQIPRNWDFYTFATYINRKQKNHIFTKREVKSDLQKYLIALSWCRRQIGLPRDVRNHINQLKNKYTTATDSGISDYVKSFNSIINNQNTTVYGSNNNTIVRNTINNYTGIYSSNNNNNNNGGSNNIINGQRQQQQANNSNGATTIAAAAFSSNNGYYSSDDAKPRKKTKYDYTVYKGTLSCKLYYEDHVSSNCTLLIFNPTCNTYLLIIFGFLS
jgi:hypothetical protein